MVNVRVGDRITVIPQMYERVGTNSWPQEFDLLGSQELMVTRVTSARVIARGELSTGQDASIWVWNSEDTTNIVTVNGRLVSSGLIPRKLGTKPEDTDEMTYIGIDHPGIQWLFEDMGEYADGRSWCGDYDRLARELGIPGRKREFGVVVERNGIQIRATLRDVSLEAATAQLESMLAPAT